MLTLFNHHHPIPPDLPNLEFRLQLLQFVTLFVHRHGSDVTTPRKSTLKRWRQAQRTRKIEHSRQLSTEPSEVNTLSDSTTTPSAADIRLPLRITLLDLLPQFLTLSALCATENPSKYWMHLAAEFMLQAVLELGTWPNHQDESSLSAIARSAFQWRCASQAESEGVSGSLFWNFDADRENEEWLDVRREYLLEVRQKKRCSQRYCQADQETGNS